MNIGNLLGLLGLVAVLALMFLRVPLVFGFSIVGGVGLALLSNFHSGMSVFSILPFSWATSYAFSCLPMFILLGLIISESKVANELYSAADKWLGRLPGGLAMASLVACAFFSALSGTALAAAATIGTVCYPEMRKYRYDPGLASGAIAVGATMDIMIPPSLPMIVFGMVADASVGKLFIAGFIPGALEVLLFCLAIFVMVKRKPSLAPLSTETPNLLEKLRSLKGIMPVLIIFIMVFGGLYGGIFTPTEAGACGVIASILVTGAMGRLSWRGLANAIGQTVEVSGTIFAIVIGVMIFSTFLGLSGISGMFSRWVISTGISRIGFLALVLFLYLPLGALMEEISMMMLTLPFYLPAAEALGIDVIWFGILIILAWQIGLVAPPVGMIAFVTQSVVKEPSIMTVYKGCLPFILALIVVEVLVLFIPDIALYLVRVMG
jgi:tripartite ATP-independent transporter DctM subunit